MSRRLNKNRLNIGVYRLEKFARTEQHVKDLAAAGVDYVVDVRVNAKNDRPLLDLFEKYGVGAVVGGVVPGWGYTDDTCGRMHEINTLDRYDAGAASFVDHPAILGIGVGDEPSSLDFPWYGEVVNRVKQLFPNQFVNLNLFPNYAYRPDDSESAVSNLLGATSYKEYIEKYCRYVPLDYICYDNYPFVDVPENQKITRVSVWYENLRIVSDACRRYGKQLFVVPMVNSGNPGWWTSLNQLRFQAYTSLAFGAETIIWGCYTVGWWWNAVVDNNGNKTEQYEKLKKVNSELRAIGEEYMRYRCVSTYFVGFDGRRDLEKVEQGTVDEINTGTFLNVRANGGEPLVIGHMVSRTDDSSALMIAAADDPLDLSTKTYSVNFRVLEGVQLTALGGEGKKDVIKNGDGTYSVEIRSNEGVLIIAK
ncbi:MAG: hypothetical protein IJU75_06380 [Clostridia bacterium]|nr:hypothetical protein [Clostridia bacterium]